MATQGLVTVKSGKNVLVKVVAGCNGYNAQKLADLMQESWPMKVSDVYELARRLHFGCQSCRAVINDSKYDFRGGGRLHDLYRKTFQSPRFNPRWENGMADHIVIINVK